MTEGQIVTGRPGLDDEFQKGLVIDTNEGQMLISITEHEYNTDMIGEEIWVMKSDYKVVDDFGNAPVYDVPIPDMHQALVLGIV